MSINLLARIGDQSTVKQGGFSGAVFLTYSLNLTFFEQIILPALNKAGCANALILADPDGYNGAIKIGKGKIKEAGLKYVCTPIPRTGDGIQHSKILLMAGKRHGRLLIGSGNLTHHGFGRNLELFSHYEYDHKESESRISYPFLRVWDLLTHLRSYINLPQSAVRQLELIESEAEWLGQAVESPDSFKVWHNVQTPLLDHLFSWRNEHGLAGNNPRSLKVVAPYFDSQGRTLKRILDHLSPKKVSVYLNLDSVNMNGSDLELEGKPGSGLQAHHIEAKSIAQNREKRSLHAKAIIGIEDDLSWCISGSANISHTALRSSWLKDGNLELINFHWSKDRNAFDYLLDNQGLIVREISFDQIQAVEDESSEEDPHLRDLLMIEDLIFMEGRIEGRITGIDSDGTLSGNLEFLHQHQIITVDIDTDGKFNAQLDFTLEEADAARLIVGDRVSEYRWIDQPVQLEYYGARSFHTRVKGQLETFDGAKSLFVELMDYLWNRIDITDITEEEEQSRKMRRTRPIDDDEDDDEHSDVPPVDAYFTEEELVQTLQWGTDQQKPYDRSLVSLRDLLSIVLLRLTTDTDEPPRETDTGEPDEEIDQEETLKKEEEARTVLDYLRSYLLRYIKKYARRLADEEFLLEISPDVLFQNHYTLGRVILEFFEKIEQFTEQDLFECFWYVWGPFVNPNYVGNQGVATLNFLLEYNPEETRNAWEENNLSELLVIMLAITLGEPPKWKAGLYQKEKVKRFLFARKFIYELSNSIGIDEFEIPADSSLDAYGIENIQALRLLYVGKKDRNQAINSIFRKIKDYRPPAREKLDPIIRYQKTLRNETAKREELIQEIRDNNLEEELDLIKEYDASLYDSKEGNDYCPRCGYQLPVRLQNKLDRGQLVPCRNCQKALIYQTPVVPKQILE